MSKPFTNPVYLSERVENMIKEAEYLGAGHNGVVYMLPNNRIIKIFNSKHVCKSEYNTLIKSSKSKYFPRVYDYGRNFIIRDYVGGVRLDKYLKKNKINRKLTENLVNLIKDFKRLNYKRLDIRCKDLYVQEDFSIKVIDPKNQFTKVVPYPRHLMKGIYKRNQLDTFLYFLKDIDSKLYKSWSEEIDRYIYEKFEK